MGTRLRSRLVTITLLALGLMSGPPGAFAATDAYGDVLPARARVRIGTTRFRHGDVVTAVAFAPDGRTVATASRDHTLSLWEVETGKELVRFHGHTGAVLTVAFTSGGKQLVSGGADGTVRVWSVAHSTRADGPADGEELRRFRLTNEEAQTVAVAADGSTVAAGTASGAIFLRGLAKGMKPRRLNQEGQVYCLALSADGKQLAANNAVSGIALWDTVKGESARSFGDKVVASLAFSPDGHTLAVGDHDNGLRLWDTRKIEEMRRFAGHERLLPGQWGGVLSIAFSADGRRLVSGGTDHAVRLWDAETGRPIGAAKGHCGWVTAVAIAPDGKHLISGGADNTLRRWESTTGREISPNREPAAPLSGASLTPDGRTLAIIQSANRFTLWNATNGREQRAPAALANGRATAFAPDGKTLAVAASTGYLQLWDLATRSVRTVDRESPRRMDRLAYSPEGRLLVSSGIDYHIDIWDAVHGELLEHIGFPGRSHQTPAFDRQIGLLVTARGGSAIRISDSPIGLEKQLAAWRLSSGALAVSFAADGHSIQTIDQWGRVRLLELARGQERRTFNIEQAAIRVAAFTPDGRFLATGSADGMVQLWDADAGKQLHVLRGHRGPVTVLAFAARAPVLASVSRDTTAMVWDLTDLLRTQTPPALDLPAREVEALWEKLAGDAPAAYDALRTLRRAPGQAVPSLRAHLRPVQGDFARMLVDLDSSEYNVRVKAARQLARYGRVAEKALRRTLENKPSLEVRRRVEELLAEMPDGPEFVLASPREARCVELLESIGTPEARRLLQVLAGGMEEAELTQQAKAALTRLARRSPP